MLSYELFSSFLIGYFLIAVFTLLIGGKKKAATIVALNSFTGYLLSLIFFAVVPAYPYTRLGNFFTGVGGIPVAAALLFFTLR